METYYFDCHTDGANKGGVSLEDARGMNRRLNGRDRDKLDQYLTAIREIETTIQKAERFGAIEDPGIETPEGIPQSRAEQYDQNDPNDMVERSFRHPKTQ